MCGFFHPVYKIFSDYYVPCMILKTGDIMMGGGEVLRDGNKPQYQKDVCRIN